MKSNALTIANIECILNIMKKISLFITIVGLVFPAICFAYSREQTMEQTLSGMELVSSGQRTEYPETYNAAARIPETVEETPGRGTFYVSAGYHPSHMHYTESDVSGTLDEDYGDLQGFYMFAGYKSAHYYEELMCTPFIEGYFRSSHAAITYKGGTSAGGSSTFDDEHAEIYQYGVKLGGSKDFTEKGNIFGYFDLGHRLWYRGQDRVIDGAIDYAEKYYWTYFGFGAGFGYNFIPKLTTSIDVEWMFSNPSLAKMKSDQAGPYREATFELRNVYGTEIRLPIKYAILKSLTFDFIPYYSYWHIKASDWVPVGGGWYAQEPDSGTHTVGLMTGLTYNF